MAAALAVRAQPFTSTTVFTGAGLTPHRILLAATRDAARCLRIDKDSSTLEPGKWADFVALAGDPLADVRNSRTIKSVWIAGNHASSPSS